MGIQYQLRIYNRAGQIQHIITDILGLSYVREVNSPGVLSFSLPPGHRAIGDFETDWQVEVWRRDVAVGLPWYCDFNTFWRGEHRSASSDGAQQYTAICVGQMDLLRRVIVAYATGTADRTDFAGVPAETIAKTLVTYNMVEGMAVVANGRARDTTITGISVQSDGGQGNILTLRCAYRNLLDVLKEIADAGAGDYDLAKVTQTSWQFQWMDGQLGQDRTGVARFALNYGNMANPSMRRDYSREPTVAIVGGAGTETGRTIVVRTGANYHPTYNAQEVFVDARDTDDTAVLAQIGDTELLLPEAQVDLSFDVLQVPGTYYGLHYTLGDLVTGYYEGFSAVKQVWRVSVDVSESGDEQIYIDLKDA